MRELRRDGRLRDAKKEPLQARCEDRGPGPRPPADGGGGQYCIDVLTQVNSVVAALRAVGMGLLDDHVRHCVAESVEAGDGDEKVDELMAAVARFAK